MRIAVIVPGGVGADGVHGTIPALRSLIDRLSPRHDVLVIATDQAGNPARYGLGRARVVCLGKRRGSLGWVRTSVAATAELLRFRPDLIHAIWLGRGSTIGIIGGRLLRIPVVVSVGGGEFAALPRIRYGGALPRRGRAHARLGVRAATAVTAGSRFALGPVLPHRPDARWLPLGAERPAPDELGLDDPKPAARPASDTLRLLVLASVNRVKGPEVVLGALARLRRDGGLDLHLDWVGEDTLDGRSAALARSLDLGRDVTFHGFRRHDLALEWIERSDILVQGSHHESQGVAVLEAAIRGVPAVGTAVGLVPELAALEPPAAIAVPVGDSAALAFAIAELANDPARLARIGAAAQAWALAHDADWTAAAFEALYAEVIRRP